MSDRWRLIGFESRSDVWIELESPDVDLRAVVVNWILGRIEDRYPGMRREPGFDNLWFAPIPATGSTGRHGGGLLPVGRGDVPFRALRSDRVAQLPGLRRVSRAAR